MIRSHISVDAGIFPPDIWFAQIEELFLHIGVVFRGHYDPHFEKEGQYNYHLIFTINCVDKDMIAYLDKSVHFEFEEQTLKSKVEILRFLQEELNKRLGVKSTFEVDKLTLVFPEYANPLVLNVRT